MTSGHCIGQHGSRNLSEGWGWHTGGVMVEGHLISCVYLIELNKILMSIKVYVQSTMVGTIGYSKASIAVQ